MKEDNKMKSVDENKYKSPLRDIIREKLIILWMYIVTLFLFCLFIQIICMGFR